MTLDEFYAELEKLPRDKYPFEIRPTGCIRLYRGAFHCACPIVVLAYHKFGLNLGLSPAADALQLDDCTRNRITHAADQRGTPFRPRMHRASSSPKRPPSTFPARSEPRGPRFTARAFFILLTLSVSIRK